MIKDVRILRRELAEYESLRELVKEGEGWRCSALERKLRRMAEEVAEQLWEVTKLIEGMEDPELRLIFELRYFRGCTWPEVAKKLPTLLSADGARMKHDRYLKKLKNKK